MMIFPKQTKTLLFAALLVFGALLPGAAAVAGQTFPTEIVKVKTASGEFFFKTEIATTLAQRQQGLMFRKTMAPDNAMVFQWRRPQLVSMWMKNTYIPLDMVFIRSSGQVANIAANTIPHDLTPVSSCGAVIAVMELRAGTAARINLRPGDMIFLPVYK